MIHKGGRPKLSISNVPRHSYESGKILIKISSDLERQFNYSRARRKRAFSTGHSRFDEACARHHARKRGRLVDRLYAIDPNSSRHEHKHRRHGIARWEEILIPDNVDVASFIAELEDADGIEYAEPIYKKSLVRPTAESRILMVPDDYLYGLGWQWALNNTGQYDIDYEGYTGQLGTPGWDIRAENAWNIETGKPEVIVAVLDTWVDSAHEDLAVNIWTGSSALNTLDAVESHGTHVAGTIAAVTGNALGVAGVAGGDYGGKGVKIMPLNLWGSHGLSTYQLFVYAADNGASIAQNSWGYEDPNVYNQSDLDGIDYFNANGGGGHLVGGITIFAAGNDGSSLAYYPGYYSEVLAVAAHDNRGVKASFSNYGTWVDISAPGVNILSLYPDNEAGWKDGTSMACPHVSAVAALILSNLFQPITNTQLRDILLNTARTDLYDMNVAGLAGKLGSGALDAYAALVAAQTFQPVVPDGLFKYRRDGVTYDVGMYLDSGMVAAPRLGLKVNDSVHYIKLGDITDAQASYVRCRKDGLTYAMIRRII